MRIQPATVADWVAIQQIYSVGIRTGHATFTTEADIPDGPTWFAGKLDGLVFKAVNDDSETVGWAALSPVSTRCVYGGVAEVSVYVAPEAMRCGVGSALMAQLVTASEKAGIWTLQAGIFPENVASVRLHEKHGFRIVGRREKIGRHQGVWRDTLLMERRSPTI